MPVADPTRTERPAGPGARGTTPGAPGVLGGLARAPLAVKVPAVTALFWAVKVLTTGFGEALSDYLSSSALALGALVGTVGLAAALVAQLRTRTYQPVLYWTAVSLVAVTGTICADVLHKVLGIPYAVSSVLAALAVAVLFVAWRAVEGTVSVHSISTTRRELFYWATVLATFALGTALGDLTAATLHLGYGGSALLFGGLILLPLLAWRAGAPAVACFWTAYVLTRPLGASVADWLGKPRASSGLGWGDGVVAALLLVGIAVGVAALLRWQPRGADA